MGYSAVLQSNLNSNWCRVSFISVKVTEYCLPIAVPALGEGGKREWIGDPLIGSMPWQGCGKLEEQSNRMKKAEAAINIILCDQHLCMTI